MYDELLDGLENSKGINKEQVQFLHMPNYLFDQPFDKRVLRGDDTDEQFEKFLENCEPSQKFVQSVHEINTTLTKSPNCELPTIPSNLNKKNGQNENINSNQNSDPIEKNSIGSDKNTNSINNNKQNDDITSNQNSILIEKNFGSNRNSNLTDTNKQNDDITSNQNSDPMEKNSIGSDRNLNLLNDNQPNMDFSILNNSPLILKQKHQKTKSKKKGQNSQKIVKKKLIHTFNQQTLFQTPRKRQKSDEILSRLRIINEYEDDISNVIMDKENIDPITKNKKPNFTKNNRGRGKGRRKRYNKNYKNVEKKDQNKKIIKKGKRTKEKMVVITFVTRTLERQKKRQSPNGPEEEGITVQIKKIKINQSNYYHLFTIFLLISKYKIHNSNSSGHSLFFLSSNKKASGLTI
ncbi:hypothetical protein M0813_22291 [Anaeramoeba flamelloides]|uniref:Uncharacterized protein n=1 Tax=Anaeramoeba flamelloides TaxID=1746091 RepID=A0ABQ8YFD6_9EUKA|nr:hypothetical protein M0813_22291 [Anaeramoeba flamelloides]